MRKNLSIILSGVIIVGFVTSVLATDDGYTVNSGSNDWNSSNWTLGHAPYGGNPGDYGFITNTPAAGTTNIVDLNGGWSVGVGGGFTIQNPNSTGLNMFLVNNNGSFSADYLTVGTNGVIEVTAGGYLIDWQQLNIQGGGTVHINGSSLSYAGYSGGGVLSVSGTLVGDSGTLDNIYNGTANGVDVQAGGQVVANSGVFQINTGSEDVYHGLQIESGGQVVVNSGATFQLNRWNQFGNWFNDTPNNFGSIVLNNGTFAFTDDVYGYASNAANSVGYNSGTIVGSGYMLASWKVEATSQIVASNGTLHIFGYDMNGNQGTFTPNNPGQYGVFHALAGATLAVDGSVASGMGGNWQVDNGGTLEIAAGKNVDLGGTFMPGSNVKGTVQIDSGANLTLSSSAAGGAFQDNQGTFQLLGGAVYSPNDTVNTYSGEFTNSATGAITGNGTLQTGFGQGGGNVNYAIINHGTITATNGTLSLNPNDALNNGGFQNASDGVVSIAGNGTLSVVRSQNEWNNHSADSVPNNSGTILMHGGTLAAVSLGGSSSSMTFSNAAGGLIQGSGVIDSSWNTVKNAGQIFADGSGVLTVGAANLNNLAGGVITANTANVVISGALNNANGSTLTMVHSVGTFNGAVVNSGAWITDPTTNVFNNTFTVTSSGYISASAGDVYMFTSNFVNQSSQNTSYNTFNTTAGGSGAGGTRFIFNGTNTESASSYTQQFFTAGLKLTGGFTGTPSPSATGVQLVSSFPAVTGFQNNFALDSLQLGNAGTNSIMELSASADIGGGSGVNALFVNDLWLFGGSQLIISNNVDLYFVNSNGWNSANYTLLGNAELHQLQENPIDAVPEPGVILLWLSGGATLYFARRRVWKFGKRG